MLVVAKMTSQKSLPNTGIPCYSYSPNVAGSGLGSRIFTVQSEVLSAKPFAGRPKPLKNKNLDIFLQIARQEKINHG
jgi:hypothetical protein